MRRETAMTQGKMPESKSADSWSLWSRKIKPSPRWEFECMHSLETLILPPGEVPLAAKDYCHRGQA